MSKIIIGSKHENRLLVFLIVTAVIIISLFIVVISLNTPPVNLHIFENIEECKLIESNASSDANIIKYDTPNKDLESLDLEYKDFYACKYISDDMEFEIFAYVFEDDSSAKEYFKNKTGKNQELSTNFSYSSGMSSFRGVVIDGNKAYCVLCKNKYKDKTLEFLNSVFKQQIF